MFHINYERNVFYLPFNLVTKSINENCHLCSLEQLLMSRQIEEKIKNNLIHKVKQNVLSEFIKMNYNFNNIKVTLIKQLK